MSFIKKLKKRIVNSEIYEASSSYWNFDDFIVIFETGDNVVVKYKGQRIGECPVSEFNQMILERKEKLLDEFCEV